LAIHSQRTSIRRDEVNPAVCYAIALALFLSSCGIDKSRPPVPSGTRPNPTRFLTARDAATAAGVAAKQREFLEREAWMENAAPFQGPEFGGRVWRLPDGAFTYTTAPLLPAARLAAFNSAVTEHNRLHPQRPRELAAGICRPRSAPRGPRGAVEVALWHTHPGSTSFSATDRALAERLRLPLFLTRDRIGRRGTVTECFPELPAAAAAK
jgi:hypothetical protein